MRLSFVRLSLPQQPLVFIALSFIGGLLIAARCQISARLWVTGAVACWVTGFILLRAERKTHIEDIHEAPDEVDDNQESVKFPVRFATCLLLLMGCGAGGGALWAIAEISVRPNNVRRLMQDGLIVADEPIEIFGTVNRAPELAPDRIYLSLKLERITAFNRQQEASGVIQIAVPLNDAEAHVDYDKLAIDYGARVRVLGILSDGRGYRNPGAPKFDELIEYRGYDATGWIKSPLLIEKLGQGQRSKILAALYGIRALAVATTLRSFRQPTSGILAAALFNNRRFLSQQTAALFREGGTFHLLVISGLHVMMIALIALWLARRLSDSRAIQYTLVMTLMWAYALMVGAQPSITRSVVMLNIALIGQLLFRSAPGTNTLAAAALVLLAWQPRDLFNPGFQLSFLTVLMVVAVGAPLYLRLQKVGRWQPSAKTPYPPRLPKMVRSWAEVLFWNEREFRDEMKQSHIRYSLEKSGFARWINKIRLQRVLTWIAVTLMTTVAVQIGLLPLMIFHFHRVSIVSPLANVVEGALVFVLMIAGLAYLLLYAIIGVWVLKLAKVVNAIGWLTVKAAEPLLRWRRASFRVPDFGDHWQLVFAGYFAGVLLLIVVVSEWNPFRKGDAPNASKRRGLGRGAAMASGLVIITLGLLLVVHPFEHDYPRGRLSVTFLDVGQGDAIVISFPRGSVMMLDSGGRPGFGLIAPGSRDNVESETENVEEAFVEDRISIAEAAVMPYLWHRGIKRLDWIVASHDDADHVGDFDEIIHAFNIGGAINGAQASPKGVFEKAVAAAGISLRSFKRGDRLEIEGVTVEALSPFADPGDPPISHNNGSLVLKLNFGNRSFLLTGDIEKGAEARLVNSSAELKADVLKVAHHGSRTSSTFEFLNRVKPQHAIISVAEPSPFGHPHPETLERLRSANAIIWRTSRCGATTFSTDGDDLRGETFVKCESDQRSGDNASRSSRAR